MKQQIKTFSRKTFQKDGKWIRKPGKTEILVCTCGNKYIKTRPIQTECLRCMSKQFVSR